MYLPRAGDADENDTPEVPRGSRERVLVVDDEEPLMRIATQALEDFGYQPIGFTSSSAALEAFRSDPLGFDAVITDERMPGMTGSTLIREVRSVRDRIPTMLMSGFMQERWRTRPARPAPTRCLESRSRGEIWRRASRACYTGRAPAPDSAEVRSTLRRSRRTLTHPDARQLESMNTCFGWWLQTWSSSTRHRLAMMTRSSTLRPTALKT
jgi:CheY-like chemotaxis protein